MKEFRYREWEFVIEEARTQCKHGTGSCESCGTSDRRDIVHRARTPDRRTARRLRRKAAKKR